MLVFWSKSRVSYSGFNVFFGFYFRFDVEVDVASLFLFQNQLNWHSWTFFIKLKRQDHVVFLSSIIDYLQCFMNSCCIFFQMLRINICWYNLGWIYGDEKQNRNIDNFTDGFFPSRGTCLRRWSNFICCCKRTKMKIQTVELDISVYHLNIVLTP